MEIVVLMHQIILKKHHDVYVPVIAKDSYNQIVICQIFFSFQVSAFILSATYEAERYLTASS